MRLPSAVAGSSSDSATSARLRADGGAKRLADQIGDQDAARLGLLGQTMRGGVRLHGVGQQVDDGARLVGAEGHSGSAA